MKTILTISGLDPSGGAGVSADIKTAKAIGLYPASVITSLTVQNTCGVKAAIPVEAEVIRGQLRAVIEDMKIDCIKIGLITSVEIAKVLAAELVPLNAPKVLDPVIFAGAGGKIGDEEAYKMILKHVDIVTPNLTEAITLLESTKEARELALEMNKKYGCDVVITGGELGGKDVVCEAGRTYTVSAEFSPVNIHGTGCVYSTALACYLGLGNSLENAVRKARIFVLESVKKALRPGSCFPVVNP